MWSGGEHPGACGEAYTALVTGGDFYCNMYVSLVTICD